MFDYHMHSKVSFDGQSDALDMALAAKERGLKEICFTDHIDHEIHVEKEIMVFDQQVYNATYNHLEVPGLKIRRGMEYGLKVGCKDQLKEDLKRYDFDFVLGSVHFVKELDVYLEPYWMGKNVKDAYKEFMEETLLCVQEHEDYDVLGHLTFISKGRANPTRELLRYEDHREIADEILRELVRKGKGMEINTSGVDRCGGFLPTADFFRRFKELGGEIVTVGSDTHNVERVGQYSKEACEILKNIFGYVCTFEGRQPIFHKL